MMESRKTFGLLSNNSEKNSNNEKKTSNDLNNVIFIKKLNSGVLSQQMVKESKPLKSSKRVPIKFKFKRDRFIDFKRAIKKLNEIDHIKVRDPIFLHICYSEILF